MDDVGRRETHARTVCRGADPGSEDCSVRPVGNDATPCVSAQCNRRDLHGEPPVSGSPQRVCRLARHSIWQGHAGLDCNQPGFRQVGSSPRGHFNSDAVGEACCYPPVMSGTVASTICVGESIGHDSERNFLASTLQWLEGRQIPFVILANLYLGGRQIDCVVATAHRVSVVEVKSSYLQVRGEINGTWERFHATGEWQTYPNAYQQALDAKYVLRDAMKAVKPVGNFYPDGHVVFTSGLADGSQVTPGDFKVTVTTLDQYLSNFKIQGAAPWSLDDWRDFAAKHTLMPVSIADVIASLEDRESADLLMKYSAAFVVEHGRDAARWLPEDSQQRNDLLAAATTGAGAFVTGPSGCGKTLMAKWVATELANSGKLTIFFAAKEFAGSWAASMRREFALLSDQNPSALLRAISRADRPVFLVLDGMNELGAHWPNALRGIRALARRLGAKLIVTAQGKRPSVLNGLRTFTVNRPSLDLKRRIAQSDGVPLSVTALEVLKAVGSGIESEIVGRIGEELKAEATRLVLVDQYIRMRLGKHGRAGAFGLRRIASWLHQQVAFSLPEVSFDEFMRAQDLQFEECDALFDAGLLVRRGARISFAHEMIQNACAAFDLAQQASVDPTTFGFRLSTPILETIAGDIVSAIEDTCTCRAVLGAATRPVLLSTAAEGELGAIAASVARELLDEAAEACVAEIRGARLVLIKENESVRIEWAEDTRRNWTAAEEAQLCAIGGCAVSGGDLNTYLGLCAEMDTRLDSERRRLADEARAAKFPLRSKTFALSYFGFGNRIGFTHVARASQPGLRDFRHGMIEREFNLADLSSGQLHFFLESRQAFFGHDDDGRFSEQLIYLLRERFRWEPYHVQLAALDAVGFAREAPEETLGRLVEAIVALNVSPANWGINSSRIDALKILGAIDDQSDETRRQVEHELASVLSDDEDAVDKDLALSLCLRMFDHPYDSIYAEKIFALSEELRRQLYRRALGSSDIKTCTRLSWLSMQVASFADLSDAPLFEPLAALPDPTNPFPQEEWTGFVVAARFLGRHGAKLPDVELNSPAERCLAEIRTLVYAADSRRPRDTETVRLTWQRLHAMPAPLVIGCLSEVHEALTDWHWREAMEACYPLDLAEIYSAECLKVARQFVEDGVDAQYFHRTWMREKGPSFAFSTIGRYGDRSDIDCLRVLSRAHPFARHALAAMRSLDVVSTLES